MYFMQKPRYNPATQKDEDYLTLKESFWDKSGRVHTRTLLTVGFLPEEVKAEDVRDIAKALTCRFGHSKEKRSDCRLLVLALCINTDGFIRYSSILEGNTADPKSLPDMVDGLMAKSPVKDEDRTLVVIDAGIATEDNLALLKSKGYNYLCVSRTRLKDYELSPDHQSVTVFDSRKQPITLREVHTDPDGDYYLEVTSPQRQ